MRILQINTVVNSGSTGRIAEDIGRVLIENGHDSYIGYGRGNRPSSSYKIKIGKQSDILSHGLNTLFFDKHGLGSKRATKLFLKKIEDIKPDAIGIHNIHGYYLNYEILFNYIKNKEIPVIWTFHDCWPFTGHCTYFDSVGCIRWKTHCFDCPKKGDYPKSFVDRSYKNFDQKKSAFSHVKNLKIITPSHWLSDQVKNSFLNHYPVKVIHNGIDIEIFKPVNVNKSERKIILGVASTWDKRKGLADFIELSKILNKEYKIVLIGLSKSQIENLPNHILGIERTENIETLVEWYNKATVFLNPTYVDNFPTTNIEALACGTPVITYDTGGSPEAVVQKLTGTVVSKGDLSALTKAIYKTDKNDALIKLCSKVASEKFNSKDRFKDYLELYQEFN